MHVIFIIFIFVKILDYVVYSLRINRRNYIHDYEYAYIIYVLDLGLFTCGHLAMQSKMRFIQKILPLLTLAMFIFSCHKFVAQYCTCVPTVQANLKLAL